MFVYSIKFISFPCVVQLYASSLPSLVLVEVFVPFGVDFISLSIVILCVTIFFFLLRYYLEFYVLI